MKEVSVKHIPIENSFMGMNKTDPKFSTKKEQSIMLNQRFEDIANRIRNKLDGSLDDSWFPVYKSRRDLKKLDCISFVEKGTKQNIEAFNDLIHKTELTGTDVFESLPFLEEGVIKYYQKYNDVKEEWLNYIYFRLLNVDLEKHEFTVRIDVYECAEAYIYFMGCDLECHGDIVTTSNLLINEDYFQLAHESHLLTNTEEIAYLSLFSDIDFRDKKYQDDRSARASNYTAIFLKVFKVLNAKIRDSYSPREVSSSGRKLTVERKDRKTGKRRVIFLGGPTLTCKSGTKLKFKNGTIQRHTMVWGVRGHYRHYKDGKVVYIRPYEKGPERGKTPKTAKEYRPAM